MSKVIFYTPAYNAEKTLRKSVDSVLNQTHNDFIYYLLDNASTDGTLAIVNEYGERDKRIIPLHNEKNWKGNWILDVIKDHSDDCYLCELDADDEYKPDFLEKMLSFMSEYNLKVAACGNDFVDAHTNKIIGTRKPEDNLILEGERFSKHFQEYYQFMRTIWGKIYSLSILKKYKPYTEKILSYGSDTLFAMTAFLNTDRAGILAESLHKYYMFPKSVSYQFDDKRIQSDQILFDAACDFLKGKCGKVSVENLDFLYRVYLNAVNDTCNVLVNSQISVTDKLDRLNEVFQNQRAQELIRWQGTQEQKNQLVNQAGTWLLSQEAVKIGDGFEKAADVLTSMGIYPTRIEGWQDGQVFSLLVMVKKKLAEKGSDNSVDALIEDIAYKSPLLSGLGTAFLTSYRDIIYSILQSDEKKALEQMEEIINQEADIPDEHMEAFLELGLKLSTTLEYTGDFIYFKKLQILFLLDLFRIEEAREQLADWDELLPNDIDFKEFRKRLTQ